MISSLCDLRTLLGSLHTLCSRGSATKALWNQDRVSEAFLAEEDNTARGILCYSGCTSNDHNLEPDSYKGHTCLRVDY
jgi:hypothetical protein